MLYFSTKDVTAIDSKDYKGRHPADQNIQAGYGVSSVEIRLPTVDDSVVETDETFELTLRTNAGYTLKDPITAVATILDDDTALPYVDTIPADTSTTASISVGGSVKGDLETKDDVDWYRTSLTKDHCYKILLSGLDHAPGLTLVDPLIESVYRADGSVIPNTWDHSSGPSARQSLLHLKLDSTSTYYVSVAQSFRYHNPPDGGSYKLSLTDLGTESEACTETKVGIKRPPPPINVSIEDATKHEASSTATELRFKVTLSRAAKEPVRVDYATSDGTAVADEDYIAVSNSLGFRAGVTERYIVVQILVDAVDEDTETLTVTLSNPRGVTIADGEAIGYIEDRDN